MKFCPYCGHEFTAETKFCPNCGKNLSGEVNPLRQEQPQRLIIVSVLLILGFIGIIYSIITISNDTSKFFGGYTYKSPFTSHEITTIMILIISITILIIGGILLLLTFKKTPLNANTTLPSGLAITSLVCGIASVLGFVVIGSERDRHGNSPVNDNFGYFKTKLFFKEGLFILATLFYPIQISVIPDIKL